MSKSKYSELTIEKLKAKSLEKYGVDAYFNDDATIYQIEALLSKYPILRTLDYENLGLGALLSILSKILKFYKLLEIREQEDQLIIYFDVDPEVTLVSAKELSLICLILLLSSKKTKNIKLYFYSQNDMKLDFSLCLKNYDIFKTNSYNNIITISFSTSEYFKSNYEKDFIEDSLDKIKLKYNIDIDIDKNKL
jgi:hypothetical protein